MNRGTKKITLVLIFSSFFFTMGVWAEKIYPSAAEIREVEEKFKETLNNIMNSTNVFPVSEETKEQMDEIQENTPVSKEDSQDVPVLSTHEIPIEKKSADQYIKLLNDLDKDIEAITNAKNMALANLEEETKAQIKLSCQNIESTTTQNFTERNAEFEERKKSLKEKAIVAANNELEMKKQVSSLSYEQALENARITKQTVLKELKQIIFTDTSTLEIGDFFREATPQYFSVMISCPKLNLNSYKGRIEIEDHDEENALYIDQNKKSFQARILYKIDIESKNYDLVLVAAEIVDTTGNRIIKRFEEFEKKQETTKTAISKTEKETPKATVSQTTTKIATATTVSKSEEDNKKISTEKETIKTNISKIENKNKESVSKNKRFSYFVGNEVIFALKNDFSVGFENFGINLQYLPLCIFNEYYTLKLGVGITTNPGTNFTIVCKNGLNLEKLSLDVGTGVSISGTDLAIFATAEMDFRFTDCFGMNVSYTPLQIIITAPKAEWSHTLSLGLTLIAGY